jgi:hypothetical protein
MRPEWADLNITANSSKRTTSNVLRSSNGQRWLADLTHVRHHHSGRDALGVDTRTSILTVQRLGKEVSECLGSCGLTTARRKLAMPHAFCRHRRQQLARISAPTLHTAVDAQQWRRNSATERAQKDDHSRLLLNHSRKNKTRHLGHRRDVDLDDAVINILAELSSGLVKELGEFVVDANVVD